MKEPTKLSPQAKIIAALVNSREDAPAPTPGLLAKVRKQTALSAERTAARLQAKLEAAMSREGDALLAAFRASGCPSVDEFVAQQVAEAEAAECAEAERVRRMTEYAGGQRALADGRPDVRDLALELSRRHEGGRVTQLTVLMVEAGMAADADEAAWRVKGREGQALAAALVALGWTRTNRSGRKGWRPPRGG